MLKKILISLAVLIILVLVAGLIAPKDFKVEREITINKPKAVVFAYLKSLKNGNTWNPWSKKDPNITIVYRGKDGEVGSVSAWSGNKEVGSGEQEITKIVEGDRIDSDLRFKTPMEANDTSYLVTESINAHATKVKWGMQGKMKFPFNLVCILMGMSKSMEKDFDEGLNNLKSNLEK